VHFHDHFSKAAAGYAAYRPRYPEALFSWLADHAPGRRLAWDCATGSGQAACGVAAHFERVVATDASPQQIDAAQQHRRVEYRVAPADASGLAAGSVELATVAQALHWFDRPAFYSEVRRVLSPGGLLAVWCYELMEIEPEIDALILELYRGELASYWPPERALVEDGYHSIDFPFEEVPAPTLSMQASWTLGEVAGYMRTWSAVLRFTAARGYDPVTPLQERLLSPWGDASLRRTVRWPLSIRVGRVSPGRQLQPGRGRCPRRE
jgi:SAM-dependent methyltransferase